MYVYGLVFCALQCLSSEVGEEQSELFLLNSCLGSYGSFWSNYSTVGRPVGSGLSVSVTPTHTCLKVGVHLVLC